MKLFDFLIFAIRLIGKKNMQIFFSLEKCLFQISGSMIVQLISKQLLKYIRLLQLILLPKKFVAKRLQLFFDHVLPYQQISYL